MTEQNPDPDPRETPGTERGGVPPGETPPGESSTSSGTGPETTYERGWAKGPLSAIILITVLVAAFFVSYAVFLAR